MAFERAGGQRMRECLSEADIAALADDQPPSRDRSATDEHLASCENCRSRLAAARRRIASSNHPTEVMPPASERSPTPVPPTAPPTVAIEGYEMITRIQGGGQGVVFKALQKSTSRMVAVKLLPHEESASLRQKQRFEREVSLAASLRHPNIVTIYDSGLTSGRYFFAMEYVHGRPLDEFARGLDRDAKLKLFEKVCSAVAHAHQQNVVHRDLKPANVLVDARGEPHVLDFGLAKSAGASMVSSAGQQQLVTLTSQFMGTLAYASPEQTMGDPMLIDRRSDVYSLGVMLFEILTGEFPYRMPGDLLGTFDAIRNTPPKKASEIAGSSGIDRDLDTIVMRALAKEPARRYQSAEELAADVHRYRAGEPIAARRDSAWYVASIRGRAALRRHPVLTGLAIIVLATLLGQFGADGLLRVWPAPGRWFEYAAGASTPHAIDRALDSVRIVAITEETEQVIEALARDAKLEGVSRADWFSVRRMHGLLMERLAVAGVRSVVWDIAFVTPSPFDADFARGVQALRNIGAGVVVALESWAVSNPSLPPIAPLIRDARVLWGGISLDVDDISAWKADLVVRWPGKAPIPSLALAAYSAMMHPKMDVVTQLDERRDLVELQFRPLDSAVLQAVTAYKTILLSAVRAATGDQDDLDQGLEPGVLVGLAAIRLPPDDVLKSATRTYHEVFAMSPSELEKWTKGKLVLFCDYRQRSDGTYDRYEAAGGRWVWGGEGHAVVIDALLNNAVPARYPRIWAYTTVIALAAAAGLAAGHRRWGPSVRQMLLLTALMIALVALSVTAYRLTGYLCHPMAADIAMISAFVAWKCLDRMYALRLE